jgi:hypothetical protein
MERNVRLEERVKVLENYVGVLLQDREASRRQSMERSRPSS